MALPFPSYDPTDYGNQPGDGPLRVGGQSASSLPVSDKANLPSTLSPAAERQQAALILVRDLAEGPDRVRDKAQTYLPKAPGEDAQNYRVRLARSVFFNAFGQTVRGLTGFVFRRDPVMGDDVPPAIRDHAENIDNAGTHIDVFLRERLQDDLTAGHGAILIDFPDADAELAEGENPTLADEEGLRPYWIPINKDNILSWRTVIEDGRTILTQAVLKECTSVSDGLFGEKEQVRYRVLWRDPALDPPVGFNLLEITKDKHVIEVDSGYYRNQTEIPLVEVISSGRRGMFDSNPPLVDLAHLNVAHYQQWSDYATAIHKTNVPIFVTIGVEEMQDAGGNKVVLGPNAGLALPLGGDAKYVSHDGAALGESQKSLDDLTRNMAALGLSMLSPDKKAADNSTATARRIDKASSDSALAVTARGLQDAAERCLKIHANYMGLPGGGSIKINRDFENLVLTPAEIMAMAGLVADGNLSQESLWDMLIEGNVLPSDFDKDEELARIAADQTVKDARNAANGLDAAGNPLPPQPSDVTATRTPEGFTLSRKAKTA